MAVLRERDPDSTSRLPRPCAQDYSDECSGGLCECTHDLWMVDARSGKVAHRIEVPEWSGSVLSAEGDVYVESHTWIKGIGGTQIEAHDARSGRVRWRSQPVPCGFPAPKRLDQFLACSHVDASSHCASQRGHAG